MDSTLNGIIIGVVGSLVAAGVIHFIDVQRKRSIQNQIEELKSEEDFLDRISKGNIQLLRSSFITLFIALGLISIAFGFSIVIHVFSSSIHFKIIAKLLCAATSIGIGSALISQAKSLKKLRNLPKEKKKLQSKREILEKKIK